MTLFKDRDQQYVMLRPEHVSAIVNGGNGHSIVFLRGGQQLSVKGEVLELWQLLGRQERLDLDKPEPPPEMDSGGAG